jgi:hypothetical protein
MNFMPLISSLQSVLTMPGCGGVTYESDRRKFTLRRGIKFIKTNNGERSWLNPWYPGPFVSPGDRGLYLF